MKTYKFKEKEKTPREIKKVVYGAGDNIYKLLSLIKKDADLSKNKELVYHVEELYGHFHNIIKVFNKDYNWD